MYRETRAGNLVKWGAHQPSHTPNITAQHTTTSICEGTAIPNPHPPFLGKGTSDPLRAGEHASGAMITLGATARAGKELAQPRGHHHTALVRRGSRHNCCCHWRLCISVCIGVSGWCKRVEVSCNGGGRMLATESCLLFCLSVRSDLLQQLLL